MRILWSIHLYQPYHNCGAESMAHQINKFLIKQGHHVRVILHQSEHFKLSRPEMYEGVELMPATGSVDAFRWADVILTHLDFTQFSMLMAYEAKRPLVHFIHNDTEYACISNAMGNTRIVYNSDWVAKKLNYKWPSMVLHPPCDHEYYNVCEKPEENEYITLINLNKNKGGDQFYKIAEAMPERKFLGVVGSYDEQMVRQLPNVTIVANTPEILEQYKRTKILLMPSKYESWGRTATEAMSSGIPVICTETPGLKENCGDAGVYVKNRNDIKQWVRAIKKVDENYKIISDKCRVRAKELNPLTELQQLENFLYDAKQTYRN